jgi:dipeptidyl aminopeptidase/acylaminoacyl peptidase
MKTIMKTGMLLCVLLLQISTFCQTARRSLRPADIYKLQYVGKPEPSPDGAWIAYTLRTLDSAKDKQLTDIWMVRRDGTETVQLTSSADNESNPQWSPDGKYISFTAARQDGQNQVWLLNRSGGEAQKLTNIKGELSDYGWSPDSKRLLLLIKEPVDTGKNNQPSKPFVINKYRFKQDVSGYLWDTRKTHLFLFDVGQKKLDTLTRGLYNESNAVWSPDGSRIAFVSNHTDDPDKNENNDIFIIDAKAGAQPRQLTTWQGNDKEPQWSPDGRRIAYTRSAEETYSIYDQSVLCIQEVNETAQRLLSKALDRPVSNHRWSKDGKSIGVLVADDCVDYMATYDVATGVFTKRFGGDRSFNTLEPLPGGDWVAGISEPHLPTEIFALNKKGLKRLTYTSQDLLDSVSFAQVEKLTSTSKDGTVVSSLLYRPAGVPATGLPLILFIHGGPVSQDDFGFDLTRQMLAAKGYAVLAVNYRGSNGRGQEFSKAIYGDWGNKEVVDLLGAIDHVVAKGIADSSRLGIGGWSYGGILTNYSIATDTRFKAASSGAGSALQLSLYGVDQYILQLDNELGQPWKNNNYEKYLKLSYPFLHADRIKTPTQFMTGEKDFNVPAIGSEQMYQALRSQDIPTELLVYPGQYHGFTQPSFIKDRFERYYQWFGKYLKPGKSL